MKTLWDRTWIENTEDKTIDPDDGLPPRTEPKNSPVSEKQLCSECRSRNGDYCSVNSPSWFYSFKYDVACSHFKLV